MRSIVGQAKASTTAYRKIGEDGRAAAVESGILSRDFFPHRFWILPKCGPDGFKLASRMRGTKDPNACWEIVLYADESVAAEFPRSLFFDDEIVWHQQQFGRAGQVASVNLVVEGDAVYTMVHLSDLVQRISRRREHKTRIENRFHGWNFMLLNSVANFATERRLKTVYTPTAELALANTDPKRTVQRELFERIYDRNVKKLFPVEREADWWRIPVEAMRGRMVEADRRSEQLRSEKTICLCHDIERGLGHREVAPEFAARADQESMRYLQSMLHAEAEAGVIGTYSVVGTLLDDVRRQIAAGGHALAFHSYDHGVSKPKVDRWHPRLRWIPRLVHRWAEEDVTQLSRCRSVDYRLKGYRPPRSSLTPELTPASLCSHNFEWLASSVGSLGRREPVLRDRLAWIPVHFDDHNLYLGRRSYAEWEADLLRAIEEAELVTFSLHDCYAEWWLPHYPRLLERLVAMGTLRTLDDVAADVTFAAAA